MLIHEVPPQDCPWPGTRQTWDDVREAWHERLDREPARAAGLALCDAMQSWRDGGEPPSLKPLHDALAANDREVRTTAANSLSPVLASRNRPFEELTALYDSLPARARLHIALSCFSIARALDEHQRFELLARCLRDRSSKVRMLAARALATSEYRPIVPILKAVAADDPTAQVRTEADRSSHLIEHGHWIQLSESEDAGNPLVYLTFRDAYIGGALGLVGVGMHKADIERQGLAAIVAAERQKQETLHQELVDGWLASHGRT